MSVPPIESFSDSHWFDNDALLNLAAEHGGEMKARFEAVGRVYQEGMAELAASMQDPQPEAGGEHVELLPHRSEHLSVIAHTDAPLTGEPTEIAVTLTRRTVEEMYMHWHNHIYHGQMGSFERLDDFFDLLGNIVFGPEGG